MLLEIPADVTDQKRLRSAECQDVPRCAKMCQDVPSVKLRHRLWVPAEFEHLRRVGMEDVSVGSIEIEFTEANRWNNPQSDMNTESNHITVCLTSSECLYYFILSIVIHVSKVTLETVAFALSSLCESAGGDWSLHSNFRANPFGSPGRNRCYPVLNLYSFN